MTRDLIGIGLRGLCPPWPTLGQVAVFSLELWSHGTARSITAFVLTSGQARDV